MTQLPSFITSTSLSGRRTGPLMNNDGKTSEDVQGEGPPTPTATSSAPLTITTEWRLFFLITLQHAPFLLLSHRVAIFKHFFPFHFFSFFFLSPGWWGGICFVPLKNQTPKRNIYIQHRRGLSCGIFITLEAFFFGLEYWKNKSNHQFVSFFSSFYLSPSWSRFLNSTWASPVCLREEKA